MLLLSLLFLVDEVASNSLRVAIRFACILQIDLVGLCLDETGVLAAGGGAGAGYR